MGARTQSGAEQLFSGGSEMAALMREVDWARTPLGPVSRWPHSLRTALLIALNSRYPMFVWWGPELSNLYNDAYIPMLGERHPQALGRSARDVWAEIWQVVGPQAEAVFKHKQATWNEELLLVMGRHGYPEETYFTFSYSPIPDEIGNVVGLFCACNEETGRVIAQRRLRTLRELGAQTIGAKTAEEVCALAARALNNNAHDLPFVLIYLLSQDFRHAHLAAAVRLQTGTAASPQEVDLSRARTGGDPWSFGEVLTTGGYRVFDEIATRLALPAGPWPEPPNSAMVLPIPRYGQKQPAGFLILGASPMRPLDEDYTRFFELVAGQVATAISEARAHEAERKRADALAELDRAKTAFFSNVSHEFRTPLTLMLGPIEDLKSQFGSPESPITVPQYQQLDLAHRNALRLTKLVNALLDFSRIEAGRVEAVYEPTDLAALTSEFASVFRSAMEQAGLKFIVDCPPLAEPAYVDREMWEKMVLNLLSNAFKFTFEGEIQVKLAVRDNRVELAVRDTGTGIPEDQLPRLFERFHRVPGARGRTHEGTGIGLALTQELARLHGGSVSVASQYGRGSTFTVSIPLGKAHLPAERIGPAPTRVSTAARASSYVAEALRWLPDAASDMSDAELPDYPGEGVARDAEHPRILVADDNADMRDYLRRLLSSQFEVELVSDGEAALAAALTRPPDLVLADITMPRLDGLGLLAQLRANPQTGAIPVILVSARAGEEARIQGLDAGADDYLVKPFSARELLARVSAHLQIASIRRKAEQAVRELNKTLEQRVAARTVELRKLASELANAERRERRRLSSILHDDLQQLLMGARLRLASAVLHAGRAAPEVRRVEELTAEALKLCRSLSVELTPPVLSQEGVLPTLQWAAERAREQYRLQTEVAAKGADPDLPEDQKALLLTAVQELLLNVVKHSGADRARITFDSTSKGVIEVQVEDKGAGCDWQGAPTNGFGLFNIRERLQWLGGTLTLSSQPNRGTRAMVRLPFAVQEEGAVNATLKRKTRAANPIRILLADDHNMVRDGLKSFIQAENDMEVIGEASDGAQAIELARGRHPDVIVIDVNMPGVNGIEATRAIKRELPHVKVIAVSVDEQQRTVDAMREAGACEFVTKEMAAETLCRLIRRLTAAAA